jgi:hypothetical protein
MNRSRDFLTVSFALIVCSAGSINELAEATNREQQQQPKPT